MHLVRLAHYPFLPEVRETVRELGPDVPTLLSSPLYNGVRRRGLARVEGALDGGFDAVVPTDERGALHELLSVPIARMLVVLAGERFLAERYADVESRRLAAALLEDPEALPVVQEALGVAAEPHGRGWRMHFTDYLRTMPGRDARWKLVLRAVERGQVPLDRDDLVGLCQETLRRRIVADLETERARPLPEDLKQALRPLLDRLVPRLEAAREKLSEGDFGPVRRELFPPCMTETLHTMARGDMVPHHGRFSLAAFLSTIGLDAQGILEFFKDVPNFDPEKSRYQVEHIAGERGVGGYTPPGCEWMQTNGACPLAKRDRLCMKIRNPLSYYRAKIRFDKEAQAKGAQKIAEAQAAKGAGAGAASEAGGGMAAARTAEAKTDPTATDGERRAEPTAGPRDEDGPRRLPAGGHP